MGEIENGRNKRLPSRGGALNQVGRSETRSGHENDYRAALNITVRTPDLRNLQPGRTRVEARGESSRESVETEERQRRDSRQLTPVDIPYVETSGQNKPPETE